MAVCYHSPCSTSMHEQYGRLNKNPKVSSAFDDITMTERRARYNAYQTRETMESPDDLSWVDTPQRVAEITTRCPPILPIILKCVSVPSNPSIAEKIKPSDVLKLIRLLAVDVVQATVEFKSNARHGAGSDAHNDVALPSALSIPKLLTSITFEVVRGSVRYAFSSLSMGIGDSSSSRLSTKSANTTRFKSVSALAKQLPRFVKVVKTNKQIRQTTPIVDGHVLEIMGVHSPWATKDKYLSCRIDKPDGPVCKLDLKWKGVIFDVIPDSKKYHIQELLNTYRLPVVVRVHEFTPTDWIPHVTSSQLKVVRTLDLTLTLERESTVEYVIGVTETKPPISYQKSDDVRASMPVAAFTSPSTLNMLVMSQDVDIDFVTSSDMTKNPTKYRGVMEHLGSVGDGLVSLIPKDIYLHETGSPMAEIIPFSMLQPKKSMKKHIVQRAETARDADRRHSRWDKHAKRVSSHHYIDFEMLNKEWATALANKRASCYRASADVTGEEDQYESLAAIFKNMAKQCQGRRESTSSQVPRRRSSSIGDQLERTCSEESLMEYTQTSGSFSNPASPVFRRGAFANINDVDDDDDGDDNSHYQVPRTCYVDDLQVDGLQGANKNVEESLDRLDEMSGSTAKQINGKCRCPNSLPRNPPPPVPSRPLRPNSVSRNQAYLVAPPINFRNQPSPPREGEINGDGDKSRPSSQFSTAGKNHSVQVAPIIEEFLAKYRPQETSQVVPATSAEQEHHERQFEEPKENPQHNNHPQQPHHHTLQSHQRQQLPKTQQSPPKPRRHPQLIETEAPSHHQTHQLNEEQEPQNHRALKKPPPNPPQRQPKDEAQPHRDMQKSPPNNQERQHPNHQDYFQKECTQTHHQILQQQIKQQHQQQQQEVQQQHQQHQQESSEIISSCDISALVPAPPSPPPHDLPSPPAFTDMHFDLGDLPIADFPPPIPGRTSSQENLDRAPNVEVPNHREEVRDSGKHKQTPPNSREDCRGSVNLSRSQSCSPIHNRRGGMATRKLPELPEMPSITLTLPNSHSVVFKKNRPSSSGNLLDDIRPPPPLPISSRSVSMLNLAMKDEDEARPSLPNRPRPVLNAVSAKKVMSLNRCTRPVFGSSFTDTQPTTIPVANIAPRPLPSPSSTTVGNNDFVPELPYKPKFIGMTMTLERKNRRNPYDDVHIDEQDDTYLNPDIGRPSRKEHRPTPSFGRSVSLSRIQNREPPQIPTRPRPAAEFPYPQATKPATSNHQPPYNATGMIRTIHDIPNDIASLDCDEVAETMRLLNVSEETIGNFRSCQMNGELLQSMTQEILLSDFNMSKFYAIKVIKFVNGWRP